MQYQLVGPMSVPLPRDEAEPEPAQVDRGDCALRRRVLGPDAAERLIGRSYLPVQILPQRPEDDFVMEMTDVRMGRMTAGVISFNAAARVVTAEAEHVHVALT